MNIKFCTITIFQLFTFYRFSTETIQNNQLYYDYCGINESKTSYYIIKDIIEHYNFDPSLDKCLILNANLINYYERFIALEKTNKNAYNMFQCSECNKKFKNKGFLNLHYKLFHLSPNRYYNTQYYCPADFCRFINCDRYRYYLSVPFHDNSKDALNYNKPVKEKYQECNPMLIEFYKKSCMKLIENCFIDTDKNQKVEKYFEFYADFCMKIECTRDDVNPQYLYNSDLQKEGGIWDPIRWILLYILSIFVFIYILIIWISKQA